MIFSIKVGSLHAVKAGMPGIFSIIEKGKAKGRETISCKYTFQLHSHLQTILILVLLFIIIAF